MPRPCCTSKPAGQGGKTFIYAKHALALGTLAVLFFDIYLITGKIFLGTASESGTRACLAVFGVGGSTLFQTEGLTRAGINGDATLVKLYLDQGLSANQKNQDGTPYLTVAAASGQPGIVGLFLGHGADVNAKDRQGQTALRLATKNGHTNIVQILKEAGARE